MNRYRSGWLLLSLACLGCPSSTMDDPDGGVEPDSDTPPAECSDDPDRMEVCGACGTQTLSCVDGRWAPVGECRGTGPCSPGETETRDGALCLTETRECSSACEWGDWSVVVEGGECEPGDTRAAEGCAEDAFGSETCDAECHWGPRVCSTPCGVVPEGLPQERERICITEGPAHLFYEDEGTMVSRRATLSNFWIMRYPVTEGGYQECVDAGECPARGAVSRGEMHTARVPKEGPSAYCEYVGGELATLAQLTRAARADCELFAPYAWSDCSLDAADDDDPSSLECGADIVRCDSVCATPGNNFCTPVTNTSISASAFGVERLPGPNHGEFVRDSFIATLGGEYESTDPLHVSDAELTVMFAGFRTRSEASIFSDNGFRCVWQEDE